MFVCTRSVMVATWLGDGRHIYVLRVLGNDRHKLHVLRMLTASLPHHY